MLYQDHHSDKHCIKMFKAEYNAWFRMYALSFKTKKGSINYLVPDDDKKRIECKKAAAPVYAFLLSGYRKNGDSLGVGHETICADPVQQ